MDREPAYHIEVEQNGCSKCGSGRMWIVIGPDGYGGSETFTDADDAADLCEQLNGAYDAGLANRASCGTSKSPAGWACTRILGHDGPCAAKRI